MFIFTNDVLIRGLLILLTVSLVFIGQVLFKYVSMLVAAGNPVIGVRVVGFIVLAFLISGCGSLVYIWLLRKMTLSNAYPFMALSFIVVPLLSMIIYGDKLNLSYLVGIMLIFSGLIVVTRSV